MCIGCHPLTVVNLDGSRVTFHAAPPGAYWRDRCDCGTPIAPGEGLCIDCAIRDS